MLLTAIQEANYQIPEREARTNIETGILVLTSVRRTTNYLLGLICGKLVKEADITK